MVVFFSNAEPFKTNFLSMFRPPSGVGHSGKRHCTKEYPFHVSGGISI